MRRMKPKVHLCLNVYHVFSHIMTVKYSELYFLKSMFKASSFNGVLYVVNRKLVSSSTSPNIMLSVMFDMILDSIC